MREGASISDGAGPLVGRRGIEMHIFARSKIHRLTADVPARMASLCGLTGGFLRNGVPWLAAVCLALPRRAGPSLAVDGRAVRCSPG